MTDGEWHAVAMDGHVHLQHDMPFDLIAENFSRVAEDHMPVCLVVESVGIDRFEELADQCDPWGSLGLRDPARGLHFVAGRQVVSREGLEILLIGSRDQALEGLAAEQVIATGLERGAAVCLPWGFGKWLGARRKLAASLYSRFSRQIIWGDITNRPSLWYEPLFAGRRVLRGSDNLPMPGSSDSVGAFGSIIDAISAPESAEDIVALLRDPQVQLKPYGNRKGAISSIAEQVRLRRAAKAA